MLPTARCDMNTLHELASYIDAHRDQVLENLDPESVDVYVFLSKRFGECDASKDRVFQFVFRSFYRLDFAGLTDAFKTEYFKALENLRGADFVDLKALAERFYVIPRRKGDKSLQFSFATKLAHTINVSYPIFDDEVAHAFGFTKPASGEFQTRLARFLKFYEWLRQAYETILEDRLMRQTVEAFRTKFSTQAPHLDDVKVLDFIFWSAGKLIRVEKLTAAPNRVYEPTHRRRRKGESGHQASKGLQAAPDTDDR
jgi:hypothetical protein